ncbi:uncharacterized protein LOC126906982 [Daktulosphaira vitifoliae]|uniref:uncharacterized protein LOC126906982 n=1 Tax=Daktulosphaira vitifoliae TaxID=58002 RepID=UPI0021AA9785|nr:uncharacterized protein LOC126906982 [Daktulosphaira vitifoliae]
MQKEVIRKAHEIGHFGCKKVEELLKKEYSMSNMKTKIESIERQIYIINVTNKTNFEHDARMNTIPGCIKSSTILQCGPVGIDFVNKKNVFAEIVLDYNEQVVENPKIKINLKITFEEQNIILKHKRIQYNFTYDEEGIEELQNTIKSIDSKIQFKVIKIYESNLSSNRTLAHSTVYDKYLKIQLDMIEKLSLWKYVKEERVLIASTSTSTLSNTTLIDFINNSTTYEKNVAYTVKDAENIMNDRTFKYAFLLVVYVYRTLLIYYDAKINWELVKTCFTLLSNAQIKRKEFNNILYDLRIDFDVIEPDRTIVCKQIITHLMEKYSGLFKIILQSTSQLSEDNLIKNTFEGFPKPHENDVISYNFQTIPTELSVITEKLEKILKLIETEYSSFLSKNYKEILNDSYSTVSRN